MLNTPDNQEPTTAFRLLLWSIPLSILVHNLEEYPRIVDYAQAHGITIGRRHMGIAVLLATILPVALVGIASKRSANPRWLRLAMALPALMGANAASHVAQTAALRDYSPGTISGISLNLPLALLFYRQVQQDRLLSPKELRQTILLGAGLMTPTAFLLLLAGWLIDRAIQTLGKSFQSY